jgi:hypothetical protein
MKRTNIKKEPCTIYKNSENFAPPVQCREKLKNPRDSDRNCFYVFCRLSPKLSIFYPTCIKSFMPIFDHRISPECLSVDL